VLLGPLNERWKSLPDLTPWEELTLAPLLLAVLALGVFPLLLLQVQEPSLQRLLAHVIGR